MATLVETTEEDPTMAVAGAIADLAWSQGGPDMSAVYLLPLIPIRALSIAEPAVAQFCKEAELYLIEGRFRDLVNLLLTSADLVLANASEKVVSLGNEAVLNIPSSPSVIGRECEGNVTVCDSQCDLLEMPAMKQLERDSKYRSLCRLLEIVLTGRLSDFPDFQAADAATLKNCGLSHEECITNMRLLSLVGLVTTSSGEISYSIIQDTRKVADAEVEYLIVRAIAAKLLEAKMDQFRQVVIIGVFGASQWQELRRGLAGWKVSVSFCVLDSRQSKSGTSPGLLMENLNNVSRVITSAKSAQGGIPQGLQAAVY